MATGEDSLSGIETEALARAAVDTERDFLLRLEELRTAGLDQQSATGAEQFYKAEQAQSRIARLADGLAERAGQIASEAERRRLDRWFHLIVLGGMGYQQANSLIEVATSAAEEVRRRALHGQLVAEVGEQALIELLKPAPGEAAASDDIDGDLFLYRESSEEELATFWQHASWALIQSCQRGSRIAESDPGADSSEYSSECSYEPSPERRGGRLALAHRPAGSGSTAHRQCVRVGTVRSGNVPWLGRSPRASRFDTVVMRPLNRNASVEATADEEAPQACRPK